MVSWNLPNIEYPVTHEFKSKLFNRVSYGALVLCLVTLSIVNVAMVGYEPTVALCSNFHDTQHFWFNKFVPPPKPGTLCDPHVFNVGESLVTNASIFEWKIIAITRPNAGKSGIAYDGGTLDNCDVVQMSFLGDLRTWSIEITAYTACRGQDNLQVMASTSMTFSPLPGRRGPLLRAVQFSSNDPVSMNLMDMFIMATDDTGFRAWSAFLGSSRTGNIAISLSADNEFCPPSVGLGNSTLLPCASEPPQLHLTATCAIDAGFNLKQDASFLPSFGPPYILDDTFRPPITNMLHLALAAIRVDLGNTSPNKFLTHPEVLNDTLVSTFPGTSSASMMPSQLFAYLQQQSLLIGSGSAFDPFRGSGPSIVQAVYVCRVLKRKNAGSLIISVFVATTGMLTSGWAIFIFVSRYIIDSRARRVEEGETDPSEGDIALVELHTNSVGRSR